MLPFLMLVEIVLEIGLFMYQLLRSNKPVRSLLSLAVMAVMIPLLFSVSRADPDNIGDAFLLGAPWLIFAAAIFLAAVHFAIALPREYRRKKNELSPFSIKEATDKLPMGICFADPNGRIILYALLVRSMLQVRRLHGGNALQDLRQMLHRRG